MRSRPRDYAGERGTVSFDTALCIHAEECVHGNAAVFNLEQRPWVAPDAASPEEIAAVVDRCPSGALTYHRTDGGPDTPPPGGLTVEPQPDGPLYVRGALRLMTKDGTAIAEMPRAALCRCGAAENKPFCDNSHVKAGFHAP